VVAVSTSADGFGVSGQGGAIGVHGLGLSAGVRGDSFSGSGLFGTGLIGVEASATTNSNAKAAVFHGLVTLDGDAELGTAAGDYRHLRIGGGNSSGFLYGSFHAFGDGIHIGYNHFANALGVEQIPNHGGGTSRISMGYGYIGLATGGTDIL